MGKIPWVGILEVGIGGADQHIRLLHEDEGGELILDDPARRLLELPAGGYALQVLEIILHEAAGKKEFERAGVDKITIYDAVYRNGSRDAAALKTNKEDYRKFGNAIEAEVGSIRKALGNEGLIEAIRGNSERHGRYRWRGETPTITQTPVKRKKRKVEFESLGNNHEAMAELLIRFKSPGLVRVHEVHTRATPESMEHTYKDLPDALGYFLETCRSSHPATFIFGQTVDPQYVETIHATIVQQRKKRPNLHVECHLLNAAFPLMNFVVLEYSTPVGKEVEVLFGWGQGDSKGAVFASKDEGLVEEYTSFRSLLLRISEPIWIEDLPAKLIRPNLP